jgi:TetR/AcrR family fatty acid metabolism transcriptional regulator
MAKGNRSKREMILEAAYDLFLNKGYWETKIIDIAEKAGIGKGTVYEYFESKDDIFFELFKTKVAAGW